MLRDSTGTIQCVVKKDALGEELFQDVKNVLIETSVIIKGVVNADERADGGHEVVASGFEIIGPVNPEKPFPITESAMKAADGGETEFLLDNRHLYLRTSRMTTMLKFVAVYLEQFTHTFEILILSNIKHPTLLLALLKVVLRCSKCRILDVQHISRNLGSCMPKQQCLLLNGCTPSHLLSELKNQEQEDILPNFGTLKWKLHGQQTMKL